jgi:tol-pal system-associated acyl-CoA thioesterase
MAQLYSLSVRVYWEDTDGAGIVYYANYLKFLERARTEWLRCLGFDQSALASRFGIVFVVRSIAAEFLRPARLDDQLDVSVSIGELGASVVEMTQTIARRGERLVSADVKLACVRIAALKPARIPPELRDTFAR